MKLPTKTVEYEVTVKKTKEVTDWSAARDMYMPLIFLVVAAAFVALLGYYLPAGLLVVGTIILLFLGNLVRSIWAKWYVKLFGFGALAAAVIYVTYVLGNMPVTAP